MSKHSIRIGGTSRPSACCRPSSASTRLWRRRSRAQPLLVEREARVALGQLEDPPLLAALGGAQLDRALAAAASASRERRALAELAAARPAVPGSTIVPAVVLEHELLAHLGWAPLGLVGEVERLAVGEHAVADLEDLGVGLAAFDRDGDRVERAHRLVGHPPALQQRAHRPQPVALERRLLELLRRGGRAHARARGRARSPRSAPRGSPSRRRCSRGTPPW